MTKQNVQQIISLLVVFYFKKFTMIYIKESIAQVQEFLDCL